MERDGDGKRMVRIAVGLAVALFAASWAVGTFTGTEAESAAPEAGAGGPLFDGSVVDGSVVEGPVGDVVAGQHRSGDPVRADVAWHPLAADPSGRFAYYRLGDPLITHYPCDEAQALLGHLDLDAAPSDQGLHHTGLDLPGDLVAIAFDASGRAALLGSCDDDWSLWIAVVEFGQDGSVLSISERHTIDERYRWGADLAWTDDTTVRFSVKQRLNANQVHDEPATVVIDTVSGEYRLMTYDGPDNQEPWPLGSDPLGRFEFRSEHLASTGACGARTRVVTVSRGEQPPAIATTDTFLTFGHVDSMQFSPDNLVSWVSSCTPGDETLWVARLTSEGKLARSHLVPSPQIEPGVRVHRGDGTILLLATDSGDSEPAVLVYDVANLPGFFDDGQSFEVADDPVLEALGSGSWYRGSTTTDQPRCEGETLYRDGPDGLTRVFQPGFELPPIVTAVASGPDLWFDAGYVSSSRVVALGVACPQAFNDFVVVWWAREYGPQQLPLRFERWSSNMPVASLDDVWSWDWRVMALVTRLDGEREVVQLNEDEKKLGAAGRPAPALTISSAGFAGIEAGASVDSAVQTAESWFSVDRGDYAEFSCGYVPFGPVDVMVRTDDASAPPGDGWIAGFVTDSPAVATPSGLRVGDAGDRVLEVLEGDIEISAHRYDQSGYYYDFVPSDHDDQRTVRFEIVDDEVVRIHAGFELGHIPVEGCTG